MQSCVGINVERQRFNSSNTTRPRPVRQAQRTSRYGQRQGRTQHASARYGDVYDVPDDDDSQTLCAGAGCGGESSGEYDECVQSSCNVADEDADGIDNVDDPNDVVDERSTGGLLSVTSDRVGSAEAIPHMEDMGLLDDGTLMDDIAGIVAGIEEMEGGDFLEAIEGMDAGSAMNADGDTSMVDQMVQLQLGEQTRTSAQPAQQQNLTRRSPPPARCVVSPKARYRIVARMEAAARRSRRLFYGWY